MWRKRYVNVREEAEKAGIVLIFVALVGVVFLAVETATDNHLDRMERRADLKMKQRALRKAEAREYDQSFGTWTDNPDGRGGTFTIPEDWRPGGDSYDFKRDW